jgi:transposase
MRTRSEVAAMLELKRRGWSISRIAAEFSVDRKTVRRYIRAGCWTGYKLPERSSGRRAKAASVAAEIGHWRGMRANTKSLKG